MHTCDVVLFLLKSWKAKQKANFGGVSQNVHAFTHVIFVTESCSTTFPPVNLASQTSTKWLDQSLHGFHLHLFSRQNGDEAL